MDGQYGFTSFVVDRLDTGQVVRGTTGVNGALLKDV